MIERTPDTIKKPLSDAEIADYLRARGIFGAEVKEYIFSVRDALILKGAKPGQTVSLEPVGRLKDVEETEFTPEVLEIIAGLKKGLREDYVFHTERATNPAELEKMLLTWIEKNQSTIVQLGITDWRALTPEQAIHLSSAIVNHFLKYDRVAGGEGFDRLIFGFDLDRRGIPELLAGGKGVCRNYAIAVEYIFNFLKQQQTAEQKLTGMDVISVFSRGNFYKVPMTELDIDDAHAYNLSIVQTADGTVRFSLFDPTLNNPLDQRASGKPSDQQLEIFSARVARLVELLSEQGAFSLEDAENARRIQAWAEMETESGERIIQNLAIQHFIELRKKISGAPEERNRAVRKSLGFLEEFLATRDNLTRVTLLFVALETLEYYSGDSAGLLAAWKERVRQECVALGNDQDLSDLDRNKYYRRFLVLRIKKFEKEFKDGKQLPSIEKIMQLRLLLALARQRAAAVDPGIAADFIERVKVLEKYWIDTLLFFGREIQAFGQGKPSAHGLASFTQAGKQLNLKKIQEYFTELSADVAQIELNPEQASVVSACRQQLERDIEFLSC